jgi:hypothetical protein
LLLCRFEAEEGNEHGPTICDRSFEQITADLQGLAVHANPLAPK